MAAPRPRLVAYNLSIDEAKGVLAGSMLEYSQKFLPLAENVSRTFTICKINQKHSEPGSERQKFFEDVSGDMEQIIKMLQTVNGVVTAFTNKIRPDGLDPV